MREWVAGVEDFDAERYRERVIEESVDKELESLIETLKGKLAYEVRQNLSQFFRRHTVVRFVHRASILSGERDMERYNIVYDRETYMITSVWKG